MIIYTSDLTQVMADVQASTRVSLDIETTGLDSKLGKILLVQVAPDASITPFGATAYVVPVRDVKWEDLQKLMQILSTKIVLAHNAKFEVEWIMSHFGITLEHVYCSMLAEKILNAGLDDRRSDLASVTLRLLGKTIAKDLQKSFINADPLEFEPTQAQIDYAAEDVIILHEIRKIQVDELIRKRLVSTAELEFNCVPVFAKMELTGMKLDKQAHAVVINKYQEILDENTKIAVEALTPYWESAETRQQVAAQLEYDRVTNLIGKMLEPYGGRLSKDSPEDIRLEVATLRKTRKKAKPNRNLELSKRLMVLDALREAGINLPNLQAGTIHDAIRFDYPDHPVLKAYAWWARANKILTTYGQNLVEDIHPLTGRIHSEYNQVVSTGRTSSSNPNAQNIPPEIRNCFVPEPGNVYVVADFSGMELRIAAGLSGDRIMLNAFDKGIDLHQYTAASAWPDKYNSWEDVDKDGKDRAAAKTCNFAVIYGGSAEALFFRGLIDDLEVARTVVKGIQKAYPVMTRWVQREGEKAVKIGYALTALGRKRFFPAISNIPEDQAERHLWYKVRNKLVREACNHPVQGTGADIAKLSMCMVDPCLPPGAKLVCFVHDELLYEVPKQYAQAVALLVGQKMEEGGAKLVNGVRMTSDVHIKSTWNKKGGEVSPEDL